MKAEKSKQPTLSEILDEKSFENKFQVFDQGCQFIDQYASMSSDIREVTKERDEAHRKMTLIRSTVFAEVSSEQTMGKPTYSNEASRNAETDRRLSIKKEYGMIEEKYKALDESSKYMRDELGILEKKISMFKAFLRSE